MTRYFVGLMSGTSMDGIDAVLVSFGDHSVDIHASLSAPYPDELRRRLLREICKPLSEPVDPDGALHVAVGECFRDAAIQVVEQAGVDANAVAAIGSHGQTLRHCPDATPAFSIQVGDPDLIATATGIPVVANFRRADIEAGGQGAPLVPPFHEWLFRSGTSSRVVVNIGGIANITVLPIEGEVTGFDTGPGNGLMDAWTRERHDARFDEGGRWAASGSVVEALLAEMLEDPYFDELPPKSTGFEYFNRDWIGTFNAGGHAAADIQATLCELTARSIADAVRAHAVGATHLFVCGGGVHNEALLQALSRNLPDTEIASTLAVGLDPDWVEACAFAWLARATQNGLPGNLPSVTGASKSVVLGEIHSPRQ